MNLQKNIKKNHGILCSRILKKKTNFEWKQYFVVSNQQCGAAMFAGLVVTLISPTQSKCRGRTRYNTVMSCHRGRCLHGLLPKSCLVMTGLVRKWSYRWHDGRPISGCDEWAEVMMEGSMKVLQCKGNVQAETAPMQGKCAGWADTNTQFSSDGLIFKL